MKAIKRNDGLYDIYTEIGFIGTVMEYQLKKAEKILEKDKYGISFYTKLYYEECISKEKSLWIK